MMVDWLRGMDFEEVEARWRERREVGDMEFGEGQGRKVRHN